MTLPRTGFIDHIGIGVPDLAATKQYYDERFATYWLDPHGFKLEAVCHTPEET
jgi:catechol 2,3-dioxygenase-like lactoylglutathione lyase family enzyme